MSKRPPHIGTSPPLREAIASLTGTACYADDVRPEDCLYLAFARSVEPSGQMTLDISGAQALGAQVYVAADLGTVGTLSVNPVIELHAQTPFPLFADGIVQSVGQPVAAVLADSPNAAAIAAEAIQIDIDANTADKILIASAAWDTGDVEAAFKDATHIVEVQVQHARLAPSPMEPRTITVIYDAGKLTIYHATQTPHRTRSELAKILTLDPASIRVIAQHVGGAFGMKASLYPEEVFAVWAALNHRRSIKWTATRSEDFLSATQGRGIESHGQLAIAADGTLLALKAQIAAPLGHWLPNSALIPAWNAARILPGGYLLKNVQISTQATSEPLAPTGIYRGAGRPEAAILMEQLIDKAAHALGRDPMELRLQNLTPPLDTPHETATGNILDSGDYRALLTALKPAYRDACTWRDTTRSNGTLAGVGLAFYLEPSGNGYESARVTLNADGTAHIASGSSDQGQGRATTLAQIAADTLNLAIDKITVTFADTDTSPTGIGALASRSTAIGGSAIKSACEQVKTQHLPATVETRYENQGQAWGYGAYLVAVEIDRDTGALTFQTVRCIDDAGTLINPALVEGQIRGGFAQGFGEAVMERIVYDEDGQLLTGSFMDYALPRAADMPDLEIDTHQTPSPFNLLGAKGVGEAGTIGGPPAILSAAQDAIGVTDLQMPLTPFRVWQAIQDKT